MISVAVPDNGCADDLNCEDLEISSGRSIN